VEDPTPAAADGPPGRCCRLRLTDDDDDDDDFMVVDDDDDDDAAAAAARDVAEVLDRRRARGILSFGFGFVLDDRSEWK